MQLMRRARSLSENAMKARYSFSVISFVDSIIFWLFEDRALIRCLIVFGPLGALPKATNGGGVLISS